MSDPPRTAPQLIALARDECLELLAAGTFGRVVVTVGDDHRPLVRPVSYVFDRAAQAVTFRSGPGTKLHALLHSASACFEIDGIDVAARTGWSVIVYGVTEAVVHPPEIHRLQASGLDSFAAGPEAEWIRVRATTITGMRIAPSAAASEPRAAASEPRAAASEPRAAATAGQSSKRRSRA